MNRYYKLVFSIIFCTAFFLPAYAQHALESGFLDPPSSAKAGTMWMWINGNVSKEGITADLEAMKRVGIHEALIFNLDQGYPEGPASFMSAYWLDVFKFAVEEAKRLDLKLGFHNGAGWSSSGGPWVTPEYGMQTLVFSEVHYKGGQKVNNTLPHPKVNLGYYKDIAVIAFPLPTGNERITDLALKSLSGQGFKNHLYPDNKVIQPSSLINKNAIIDLTDKMSADGTLDWTVPNGDWTVLRIGHTPNGTKNRPAGIGGLGLECDKLSRAAVDVFWAGGIQPIIDKMGPLIGTTLVHYHIDSYEVGCGNWTDGFDKEFKSRRGYDCLSFLPTIAGYYVESGEVTERFLWDFRRTIGDLTSENYYNYLSEKCHQSSMKLSLEPYGGPFEAMQAGGKADLNLCEFWIGDNVYRNTPKLAVSIAHLNGQSIIGSEAFTSIGGFVNHPATIKELGDWVWSEGINQFIFHAYAHQPWNVSPGMTFHMYGLEMSRLNTWWEQSRAYMDYIARSQYLLQQGKSVADVLVFTGEASPNDGIYRPDIKALGYDYDEIGTNKIAELTVQNGLICTPARGKYRLLVLPETDWITPELLSKIKELVDAGAIVMGTKPTKSPSLGNYPECDKEVVSLTGKLWADEPFAKTKVAKGKIINSLSVPEVLKALALPPDFSGGKNGSDLNFIHRLVDGTDIYFVANPQKHSRKVTCSFRVTGKQPQLWNSETGSMHDAAVWEEEGNGITKVSLSLEEEASVFVVFKEQLPKMHIIQDKISVNRGKPQPMQGLKIIKAEYGTFLPEGLVDVTETLNSYMKYRKANIAVDNSLSDGKDPAVGVVKELRAFYEINGERHTSSVAENTPFVLQSQWRIIRALYGKFPDGINGVPDKSAIYNVTDNVKSLLVSEHFIIPVNNNLVANPSANDTLKKELRMTYEGEGEKHEIKAEQGNEVDLTRKMPEPQFKMENNKPVWITPYPGKISYVTSSGYKKSITVSAIPQPIELKGKWEVNFPPNLGAPGKATFDKLISWALSPVDGIRYFSGTATYHKDFSLTKQHLGKDYSLELDLGAVKVIAEVWVNGKNLGVLWKAPFRVNLNSAVHAGNNKLEIRITNLWPNRLIGDDRLPADFDWGQWTLKSWPNWLLNKSKRLSERITFTTWKHWNKDSQLQASGLLGPVVIRSYKRVNVLL